MIDIKAPKGKSGGSLIRIAGIAGFIAIIGIGMWGSVAVARNTPGVFSSLVAAVGSFTSIFVPAAEKITLSVPSLTVNAGETFQISWEHEKKSAEGSYTFRYDCADGVYFNSPTPGGAQTTAFCNTPFNFINSGDTITLTAQSTENRFIDVTLYIDFTPNGGGRTVVGSTVLTIANEDLASSPSVTNPTSTPATPSTPSTPSTPTTPTTPGQTTTNTYPLNGGSAVVTTSNPNGYVDLAVYMIEQGVVDKTTGAFTASSTPNRIMTTHRVAVRFAVENRGTKTSPAWTLNAVLPTTPSTIFANAPTQQALGPGDRIEFTLGFDQVADADTGTFIVNVDPAGAIMEPNKANNIASTTVTTRK